MSKRIDIDDLNVYYGKFHDVASVTMQVPPRTVTALIGPSGCGKSTVLRTLNRMHEVIPGAYAKGRVELDGADIYAPGVDPVSVRRTIGMVFQRPNPFPTMSIKDNVVSGLARSTTSWFPRRAAPRSARRKPARTWPTPKWPPVPIGRRSVVRSAPPGSAPPTHPATGSAVAPQGTPPSPTNRPGFPDRAHCTHGN